MTISVVPLIEKLRVAAVQYPHASGKFRLCRLDDQVAMSCHQAVRMTNPGVASDDGAEQSQERLTIDVVKKDLAVIRAAVGDVIDPFWKLLSCSPWHVYKLGDMPAAR